METDQYVSVNELRKSLIDEIIKSVGLPRTPFWRKVFSPIFWLPTDRFSRFGSNFDKLLTKSGFNKAFINALSFFVGDVEVHGGNNIPKKGPLLVVSNHPGTYDSVVIAAHLPRDDVKIVSSDIPFIQKMRNANRHFLFTTRDTYKRMIVIKRAIRHLKSGGAILIFPSGHIDPEPAIMPEAMNNTASASGSGSGLVLPPPDETSTIYCAKVSAKPESGRARIHARVSCQWGRFEVTISLITPRGISA